MNEKIYCSQCHNSAFVATNKTYAPTRFSQHGHTKCLYCFVLKDFLHYNIRIKEFGKTCPFFKPENVEKLRTGVWNARTETAAIKDHLEHNRVQSQS